MEEWGGNPVRRHGGVESGGGSLDTGPLAGAARGHICRRWCGHGVLRDAGRVAAARHACAPDSHVVCASESVKLTALARRTASNWEPPMPKPGAGVRTKNYDPEKLSPEVVKALVKMWAKVNNYNCNYCGYY